LKLPDGSIAPKGTILIRKDQHLGVVYESGVEKIITANLASGTGEPVQLPVPAGSPKYAQSASIRTGTTVQLTQDIVTPSGHVIPKGSVVTQVDNTLRVTLPDGAKVTANYQKVMTAPPRLVEIPKGEAALTQEAQALLQAAKSPFKGQPLTNAGRATTKHPEYFGFPDTTTLRATYRTDKQLNELASKALDEILANGISSTGAGGRYPNGWVTYTLPDGRAASWHASGEFIGFRGKI
ncbi:hypothetical protein HF682_17555, partial [Leeia sp. IMCC25680]|nr:hypothetical protein [Leeia aquatica]